MKNLLLKMLLFGSLGLSHQVTQSMWVKLGLAGLSKTTTVLKWSIAGAIPWYAGYDGLRAIFQDPNELATLCKSEKILPEEEKFLREGDDTINVYVNDSHSLSDAGGFSSHNLIIINRWQATSPETKLPQALQENNEKALSVFAALRDHEKSHVYNGDHIIRPLVFIAIPFITGYALHSIKHTLFPIQQGSNLRQIARSVGRIPSGVGLCAANVGIQLSYRQWREYRADTGVKPENIDGMIHYLLQFDKEMQAYARKTGSPRWSLTPGHPPIDERIRRLENRKQLWEASKKGA
jgi:hypothetical protein